MKMIKEGRTPLYSTELKIAIAREYLTCNLGYGKLAKKYNLPNPATVRYIVKWYKSTYPDVLEEPVAEGLSATPSLSTSATDKGLKEANLKIMALELLISNINKEVGFDVVKKFGTKQSTK